MHHAFTKLNSKLAGLSIAIVAYSLVFLLMRLVNLRNFPVFGDEVLHIWWAQSTGEGNLFVGLESGLRLTYIWLLAVALQFFNDPLLTARALSVMFGLAVGGICYTLATIFYPKRRIGYLAALFCLLIPFALFHERMAFTDSLLTMLVGLSLLVSVQLWRNPSPRWAVALGFTFVLATLTKSYAVIYYGTPILLWLFLKREIKWGNIVVLITIVYGITLLAWLPTLVFGEGLASNSISHLTVIGDSSTVNYFEFVGHNLLLAIEWLSTYLTLPVAGFVVFAVIVIVIKRDRPGLILTIVLGGHLLFFTLLFTRWYPRYLLSTIVPMSVIFARGIDYLVRFITPLIKRITHKTLQTPTMKLALQIAIFLILFIPALSFDYLIITAPLRAPFPVIDRWQYFGGPYAGYGLPESAQFIKEMTKRASKLTILSGSYSLDVRGLEFYLLNSEEVSVAVLPEFDASTIQTLDTLAQEGPTLAVRTSTINNGDNQFMLPDGSRHPQVWQVAHFPKPNFQSEFESYDWFRLPNSLRQDALISLQTEIDLYQWLLPPDFALHWFQQGGDAVPRIAWQASDTLVTANTGVLIDWPQTSSSTPETMQQALAAAGVEYVLANPDLVKSQPDLFAPFMATDGTRLQLTQLPPGWRLAFAYPDLHCQWCLFQLKSPDYSTKIAFGEAIELEGYDVSATQLLPREPLHITLYWQSLKPLTESYMIFAHLINANGQLMGQVDEYPLQGKWPTNNWRVGDRLADRHTLRLDTPLPTGDYTVRIGLYNPANLERMPAYAEQNPVIENAVNLTTLSVK